MEIIKSIKSLNHNGAGVVGYSYNVDYYDNSELIVSKEEVGTVNPEMDLTDHAQELIDFCQSVWTDEVKANYSNALASTEEMLTEPTQ